MSGGRLLDEAANTVVAAPSSTTAAANRSRWNEWSESMSAPVVCRNAGYRENILPYRRCPDVTKPRKAGLFFDITLWLAAYLPAA
jgi:hypothetical protein